MLAIRAIKMHGHKIELSENIKGKPVARLSKLMTAGKNKGQYKLLEAFYFADEDRRQAYIDKVMKNLHARHQEEQAKEQLKKDIRDNFKNPYNVGDILYNSWGYEQTNIDFYQVADVKGKSILLQSIGADIVEGSQGDMTEYVKPNPAKKIGEPELKNVQFYLYDNKPTYYIKMSHGSLSPYTQGDKGLYQSHYA